jgi:hypothetical protein
VRALVQITPNRVRCEDSSLLGCYLVSTGKHIRTFRKITMPSSGSSSSETKLHCSTLKVKTLQYYVQWMFIHTAVRTSNLACKTCCHAGIMQLDALTSEGSARSVDGRPCHWKLLIRLTECGEASFKNATCKSFSWMSWARIRLSTHSLQKAVVSHLFVLI